MGLDAEGEGGVGGTKRIGKGRGGSEGCFIHELARRSL